MHDLEELGFLKFLYNAYLIRIYLGQACRIVRGKNGKYGMPALLRKCHDW
jgi:hypothetical protein